MAKLGDAVMGNEIVLYESSDGAVTLPVNVEKETVWLDRVQMAELFDRESWKHSKNL